MAIPEKLQQALIEAEKHVDSRGELPPAQRGVIFELIESLSVVEHPRSGFLRRARSELLCAQRSLPALTSRPIEHSHCTDALRNALLALQGAVAMDSLRTQNNALHTLVVDMLQEGSEAFRRVYAGMSVYAAVNAVLFDIDSHAASTPDIEVPPDEWTASFYASLTQAGAARWEEAGTSDDAARRTFWLEYLRRVLPDAWEVRKEILI